MYVINSTDDQMCGLVLVEVVACSPVHYGMSAELSENQPQEEWYAQGLASQSFWLVEGVVPFGEEC